MSENITFSNPLPTYIDDPVESVMNAFRLLEATTGGKFQVITMTVTMRMYNMLLQFFYEKNGQGRVHFTDDSKDEFLVIHAGFKFHFKCSR